MKIDKQWARGKSFDTFALLGPWILTDVDGDHLLTGTPSGVGMGPQTARLAQGGRHGHGGD